MGAPGMLWPVWPLWHRGLSSILGGVKVSNTHRTAWVLGAYMNPTCLRNSQGASTHSKHTILCHV